MNNVAVFTITSELHDASSVDASTHEFLKELQLDDSLLGGDFATYGSHALDMIFVRTGGTEGIFKRLMPTLLGQSRRPFYLLTSGKSNSLAASMEILSYLRQNGLQGEIIHGKTAYMAHRIELLTRIGVARAQLKGCRLGIVGKPSDWLISSRVDDEAVKERLGLDLVDVPMQELQEIVNGLKDLNGVSAHDLNVTKIANDAVIESFSGAYRIYLGLKMLTEKYHLQGFTIRCFDLLDSLKNTGCWALAQLNSEGIVAGCEGDVPALISMMMVKSLTGVSGFQANPASVDPDTGEMIFAHCTIPFNMVMRYEFDTHFESGIGIGIRGYMQDGPVTIFKVAGNLSRSFIEEGVLLCSLGKPNLCRTQLLIRLDNKERVNYFLKEPIGNHHIIVPGRYKEFLTEFLTPNF